MSVTDVYLLDLSTDLGPQGEPRRLTFLNQSVDSPVWTPDGREIVFSSGGHLSQHSLWRVSASAGSRPDSSPKPEPVGEEATTLAVSSTARRLIYTRHLWDSDIYRIDLRLPGVAAGPPVKLISSTRNDHNAEYSPDGRRIAFNSHRSGAEEIWVSNADGSNPAQLTSAGGPMVANPRWSPDGRSLVFHSLLGGARDILLISANGGAIQRLGDGGKGGGQSTWSRDGKWIYFGSSRGGRSEVWKMPSGGGEPVQVTRNGGWGAAFESPDGKFLYYTKSRRVWRVPLAGGDETQVLKEPLNYASDFVVVEEGIYFLSGPGASAPGVLYLFEFATGALRQIATMKSLCLGLTISPDRRSILFSQFDQPGSDLMLVENFR
jgi:Tol biopolymer transport system component